MSADKVTRKHAVIVGAGMAGLLAAEALSDVIGEVTIIEKDDLSEVDPEVHALSVRVTYLLEPPSVMARADIIERANLLG
jgi:2-polyprenyl-6-methoxyphenol hydroxylase-like FAD-dependent oxidoreductase